MSKPLTIDELKALPVGDWAWIEHKCLSSYTGYYKIIYCAGDNVLMSQVYKHETFHLSGYGIDWLAYKNKEQAEAIEERFTHENSMYYEKALVRLQELENKIAKGEIVELPCKIGDLIWVVYRDFDHGFNEYKIYESICTGFAFENGTKIRIVTAFCCYDFDRVGNFTDKSEAEARLKELRGEK